MNQKALERGLNFYAFVYFKVPTSRSTALVEIRPSSSIVTGAAAQVIADVERAENDIVMSASTYDDVIVLLITCAAVTLEMSNSI